MMALVTAQPDRTVRRRRRGRWIGGVLLGRLAMTVWVAMPLMPALGALLSWLTGLD